jgi:hypothetical protein
MGNIAFRSGKKISWNENNKKFTDDAIQAEYYMKQYNNGYKLPTL